MAQPTRHNPQGVALEHVPPPPPYFGDREKRIFTLVATDLYDRGMLYESTLSLIELYAETVNRYREAADLVKEQGMTYIDRYGQVRKHPTLVTINSERKAMRELAEKLTLSPYSRARTLGREGEPAGGDPLSGFIK